MESERLIEKVCKVVERHLCPFLLRQKKKKRVIDGRTDGPTLETDGPTYPPIEMRGLI